MTFTSTDWMRSPEPNQAEAEPDVRRRADRSQDQAEIKRILREAE